jgi:hypothetical protein
MLKSMGRGGFTSREPALDVFELHDLKRWGCTGVIAADYHNVEEARQIAALKCR